MLHKPQNNTSLVYIEQGRQNISHCSLKWLPWQIFLARLFSSISSHASGNLGNARFIFVQTSPGHFQLNWVNCTSHEISWIQFQADSVLAWYICQLRFTGYLTYKSRGMEVRRILNTLRGEMQSNMRMYMSFCLNLLLPEILYAQYIVVSVSLFWTCQQGCNHRSASGKTETLRNNEGHFSKSSVFIF